MINPSDRVERIAQRLGSQEAEKRAPSCLSEVSKRIASELAGLSPNLLFLACIS